MSAADAPGSPAVAEAEDGVAAVDAAGAPASRGRGGAGGLLLVEPLARGAGEGLWSSVPKSAAAAPPMPSTATATMGQSARAFGGGAGAAGSSLAAGALGGSWWRS